MNMHPEKRSFSKVRRILAFCFLTLLVAGCKKTGLDGFKAEVKKDPNSAKARTDLAWYYDQELKQFENAKTEYKKALEITPDDLLANSNLGELLFRQENYQEALVYFTKAHEINPKQVVVMTNIGNCHEKMENHEEAAKWYQKALDVNPDFQNAKIGLEAVKSQSGGQ